MKYFKTHTQFLNEVRRSKEPFTFSEKEVEDVANLIAKAISKVDKTKAAVHDMEFADGEGAGFEISMDGEKYDGGSYDVRPNGDVVNVAIGNSFPNAVYAKIGDKNINQIIKNIKKFESVDVSEARRGTIHSAAKKASYPVTLVATEKGKVVDQKLVGTPMIVPAAFNEMQKEFPNAKISVESKTGQIVFTESAVTEAKLQDQVEELVRGLDTDEYEVFAFDNDIDPEDANQMTDFIMQLSNKDAKAIIKQLSESVVTEGKFNKRKLMKAMKKDDGFIQLGNGQEYIIYNPNNGNQDNTDMWDDKVIFALDQDGEEHEIKYSDIVSYNESRKINLKAAHLSSEEYQKAKKLKDFDKEDWEWNSKSGLYDRVNEATDVNDPVLIAFRASRRDLPKFKPAKAKSRRLSFDKYMDLLDSRLEIDQQIKDLGDEMAQTLRDMEQEAEPEGGEVADRYGSIMMDQEKEYAKLKAKKDKIMARIEKHRMS